MVGFYLILSPLLGGMDEGQHILRSNLMSALLPPPSIHSGWGSGVWQPGPPLSSVLTNIYRQGCETMDNPTNDKLALILCPKLNVTVRYHSGGSMKLNACILVLAHMVYI